MADENIDLTTPPPAFRSHRSPRILQLRASVSARRFQFGRAPRTTLCPNPNMCYINQQIAPWMPRQPSRQIYGLSRNVSRFQPRIHQDDSTYEPVTELNAASLLPHGAKFDEHWTPQEHELLMMGLRKYGRGRWGKIVRHFVWTKTPQQVKSYAENFLRHLPSTNLHGMNPPCAMAYAADLRSRNENLMSATASFSNPMTHNEPQPTLRIDPKEAPFSLVPPTRETSSSTHRFQMQTGGASTSMTASDEIDLELRLGWS